MEEKRIETIISKNIVLSYTNLGYVKSSNAYFNFKFDEKQMEKHLKLYTYYDTKNKKTNFFKVYDLLSNLRSGLVYKYNSKLKNTKWESPFEKNNIF